MLDPEIMRRIRQIELRTRRLVNDSFAGSYRAVFKGRGMTFDSVRAYEPGDDVRRIDWNVTARTGEPFIKQFVEERELTVMLVLDASASILFGTAGRTKRDLAAELGAVLALSATRNNDRVGLLVFSDQVELFVPPRKGRNHILRLIRDLMAARPAGQGTDMVAALRTLNRVLKHRSIIFLISDFLLPSDEYLPELRITSRRHDVIAITLNDRLEHAWPAVGLVSLKDAESGARVWVDTGSADWRLRFGAQAQRFQQMRETALTKAGVDRIHLVSDDDYLRALAEFFRRRERAVR